MIDFQKKTGVNYDYILTLQNEDNKVTVVKYPIIRHDCEIEIALKYLDDENADASDIYNVLRICLTGKEYDYCLKHEYTASYIAPIKVEFNNFAYSYMLRDEISSRVGAKLRWLSNEDRNSKDKLIEIKQLIRRQMYYRIRKDKERLLDIALPYVYANDYDATIRKNNIMERSIIFSHERRGDERHKKYIENSVEHKVNNDISIKVETNFCYGCSSYFHVTVIYKGIALLPYSVWVRYYFAGISELLRCTRSYKCSRDSWHICMAFLENFINSAISNPEDFIRTEVMREVNGLIKGLEEIFLYKEEQFEKEIKVKERPGDERYIGIRGTRYATENDVEEYKIAPHEIAMIYKMEKISGALLFLDNLRKIKEIYTEVSDVIDRIIEMNQIILPEVENTIPPVENEIRKLNAELNPLNRQLKSYEVSFDKLQQRLDRCLGMVLNKDKILTHENRERIINEFVDKNPQYLELKESIQSLKRDVNSLENKICKRERVLKKLNDYKSLILKYSL